MYNIERTLGLITGIIVGIVVAMLLIRFLRVKGDDNSRKVKYDERQEVVRGRAYKYSFYTMMIGICAIILGEPYVRNYIGFSAMLFSLIVIGISVYTVYCIFKDAYFALNDNPKRWFVVGIIVVIVNIGGGISMIMDKGFDIKGDIWGNGFANIMAGVLFLIIFIAMIIKKIIGNRE